MTTYIQNTMTQRFKSWLLKKFNEVKHKRWFQVLAALFIVRWLFRLAVLAYIAWLAFSNNTWGV